MRLTCKTQIEPLCKTFLCFYSAISNEFLGRTAHLYSPNKVPLLHEALDSFLECGAALPQLIPMPKLPPLLNSPGFAACLIPPETPGHCPQYTPEDFVVWVDTPETATPERPALIRTITQMIDLSLSNQDDDPFISDSESDRISSFALTLPKLGVSPRRAIDKDMITLSPKTPQKSNSPMKSLGLTPSPLCIRKSSQIKHSGITYEDERSGKVDASPRSKRLPLQVTLASKLNIMDRKSSATNIAAKLTNNDSSPPCKITTPSSVYSRDSNGNKEVAANVTPAHATKIVRFNRGIELLREQILTNIAEIQQHVEQVKDVQRARRARQMKRAPSFWSFHPTTDEAAEEETEQEEHVQEQKKQEPGLCMHGFENILHKETQQQRLARLRSDGWSTVGLRSANSTWKGARYYQEFCNMVLTELSLDN
ncbi:uncharacterized protein N7443_008693 [Penicillium atrosanguineum]|uniref:Uncharacterized protein n=1 Tax=Penicillium atrosanguineum TaxID=1132637 RepID=A0A9W9PPF5_9EURO|nr:uncharacterized protein N7443_008693 [Penicillium atrosanguineum]KAJ5292740.1 hypothetical protein N7443_008693 [Penicillium atrosanguineum]KAJ5303235.1 hypothetical protein N7476_010034 [Penicillium atrosanguineum]